LNGRKLIASDVPSWFAFGACQDEPETVSDYVVGPAAAFEEKSRLPLLAIVLSVKDSFECAYLSVFTGGKSPFSSLIHKIRALADYISES